MLISLKTLAPLKNAENAGVAVRRLAWTVPLGDTGSTVTVHCHSWPADDTAAARQNYAYTVNLACANRIVKFILQAQMPRLSETRVDFTALLAYLENSDDAKIGLLQSLQGAKRDLQYVTEQRSPGTADTLAARVCAGECDAELRQQLVREAAEHKTSGRAPPLWARVLELHGK